MTDRAQHGASPVRVGILDRDTGFLQVLTNRLDRLGHEHRLLASPVSPDDLVAMRLSALVVDLAVLGPQAWDYLDRVTGSLPGLGVIVCTGRSSVGQRVRGMRMGADDWVTKPCHPEEVIARVEAVVRRRRRTEGPGSAEPVFAGEVEIRPERYQAYVGERSVDLTRREFELLQLLADAQGCVLEREEIYQRVWGYAMARGDRSVDVFVRKLRLKLEKASPKWRYIHTHFGVGYRFAAESTDPAAPVAPATAEAATPAPAPVDPVAALS
jgi:DNA-binding response OmpR family regulator